MTVLRDHGDTARFIFSRELIQLRQRTDCLRNLRSGFLHAPPTYIQLPPTHAILLHLQGEPFHVARTFSYTQRMATVAAIRFFRTCTILVECITPQVHGGGVLAATSGEQRTR